MTTRLKLQCRPSFHQTREHCVLKPHQNCSSLDVITAWSERPGHRTLSSDAEISAKYSTLNALKAKVLILRHPPCLCLIHR